MRGFGGKYAGLLALLVTALSATAALYLWDPATSGLFPPCPLRAFTGWYCPGCGSLRAFHQLLHGNLLDAVAMNSLAVLSLPFLAYGVASYAAFVARGSYLPRVLLPPSWVRLLGAGIVAFGIARNFPMYPFWLLAPGGMLSLR